jgi:predicted nucleic-acid-binding Zn-ribbon protein
MSFKLLKQVISHLKKTSKCPYCGSGFSEDFLYILATGVTQGPDGGHGLFFVMCPKCHAHAFVFVEVTMITARLKKEHIRIHTKPAPMPSGQIDVNEILDMHNFLKNWEGDMKELFKGE